MKDKLEILKKNEYEIIRLISSGAYGDCYFVKKHGESRIVKVFKENDYNECSHEESVYVSLQGDGLGVDWLFKAKMFCYDGVCFLDIGTYEGDTFREYLLNEKNNTSLVEKLDILIKACNGIMCMHKNGFLHLDIKPSNFYISKENKYVKPIDMGSAVKKDRNIKFDSIMSATGYMSTEGFGTKKLRRFKELRDKYSLRKIENNGRTEYKVSDSQKDSLINLCERIGVKDDIYALICCIMDAVIGKKVDFWLDDEYKGCTPENAIRIELGKNNISEYLYDYFIELFMELVEPNKDENSEVSFDSVDSLIKVIEEIIDTENNCGITEGNLKRGIVRNLDFFNKMEIDSDMLTETYENIQH